ncbi:RBBP9/YdeN family alpha/beta hydrolase [Patescibacteria group bacterium]
MPTTFIFHGVGGSPQENWFPWLKEQLEDLDQQVIIPQFPTPEGQTLENWLNVLDQYKEDINEDAILIGHSLGVPFALNVLERYKVKAAFLVSGFYGKADNQFDPGMVTFAQREFDWEKIKSNCEYFYVFHSDNDPYIKLEKAEKLAEKLEIDVTLVPGAGHINQSSGYTEFDILLSKIKEIV